MSNGIVGRLARCKTMDNVTWIGRVVAITRTGGHTVSETHQHAAFWQDGEWRVVVEDENGELFDLRMHRIRLLPMGAKANLGFEGER